MTKGDTAVFNIDIKTPEGKAYRLRPNDRVVFHLIRSCNNEDYEKNGKLNAIHSSVFTKEFEDNLIRINADDTVFLDYGEYEWKCQLLYGNGDVNSICGGKFFLSCVSNK